MEWRKAMGALVLMTSFIWGFLYWVFGYQIFLIIGVIKFGLGIMALFSHKYVVDPNYPMEGKKGYE